MIGRSVSKSAPIDPILLAGFEKNRKIEYVPASRTLADDRAELLRAIQSGEYTPTHPELFDDPNQPFGAYTEAEAIAQRKMKRLAERIRVLAEDRDILLDSYEYPVDPVRAALRGLYTLKFGEIPYDQDSHQNPCKDVVVITRAVYDRELLQIMTYGTSADPAQVAADLNELWLIHGIGEEVEASEEAA